MTTETATQWKIRLERLDKNKEKHAGLDKETEKEKLDEDKKRAALLEEDCKCQFQARGCRGT